MAYEVILKKKLEIVTQALVNLNYKTVKRENLHQIFSKCSMKETWLLSSYLRNHKDIYLTLDEINRFL